jgi:hypothetical protein
MTVDISTDEWMGAEGPAGVAVELLQRVYVAKANEKDLRLITEKILALTGEDRVKMRECMAWLAGMESESPEFNELGRCGLHALRAGELDYYHEPGFYPEHILKIRLFNVRSALNRPTKGQRR